MANVIVYEMRLILKKWNWKRHYTCI